MTSRTKKIITLTVSAAVSILLIGLLVSRIETRDLVRTIRDIHRPALAAYIAAALAGAVLRAWRYKILLHPRTISWPDIMMVTFIRNSFVDLLPARIGSLSFILIMNRRLGFPFESATSAFLASLVLDFITLGPFVILAAAVVGLGTSPLASPVLAVLGAAFSAVFIIILIELPRFIDLFTSVFGKVLSLFRLDARDWAVMFREKLRATSISLRDLKKRRIDLPLFGLSFLIRGAKYAALSFLVLALLHSHGVSFAEFGFFKLILGVTGAELTSVLPVKGLAGFGTWEAAWALTFSLMGIDEGLAIISGLGVHLLTNVFEYSLGIASLIILLFPWLRRSARRKTEET